MRRLSKLSVVAALIVYGVSNCFGQSVTAPAEGKSKAQETSNEKSLISKFVHPGVAHSSSDIEFVREQIKAKKQPWYDAWRKLKSSRKASLKYKAQPREVVERGPYNHPDIGSSEFSDDGEAAYVHALIWAIGQDKDHAKKSAEILDAWSSTLKEIGNHDAKLLTGMSGFKYVVAAELLKHTSEEWSAEGQQQFAKMAREVWYPLIKELFPSANGNWDASMLQMIMAMGVHLEDKDMVQQANDYFLGGIGNGAIGHYFNDFGECQESGRDQAHTQMGLDFLSNTCETAWIQGIDLYGGLDNRLQLGFEYTAKYNLGEKVPYERYLSFDKRYDYKNISSNSRGRLRPMYEKILRHYQYRQGIDSPYTEKAVEKVRSNLNRDRSRSSRRRYSSRRDRTSTSIDILMYATPIADAESDDIEKPSE